MSRKIKFRALIIIQTLSKKDEYNSDDFIYSNGYYFDGYNYWFIIPKNDESLGTAANAIGYALHEIINIETFGQFTGLHDKNGTEIYEGDLLKYTDTVREMATTIANRGKYYDTEVDGIFPVNYSDNRGFQMYNQGIGHCEIYSNSVEIVGNIHQNPELI